MADSTAIRSPLPGKLRLSAVIILSPPERISGRG